MARLNQIIAVEKGIKSRVYGEITQIDKANQKAELFSGLVRTYRPLDEEDAEKLPGESKRVQLRATEVLNQVARLSTEWWNVTARKDWANCYAIADVVVDGAVMIAAVPVTHLLFLEKQLTDLRTLADRLPVLDEAETWSFDANSSLYRTPEILTHRTKKVAKPIVLYPATPEHPAQTQVLAEDVIAGHWAVVKQSGALPRADKDRLMSRIEKVLQAVKQAREEANSVDEVPTPAVADAVFTYVLAPA